MKSSRDEINTEIKEEMRDVQIKEEVSERSSSFKIKEESLEQSILPLYDYALKHNDVQAALQLIKVEAALLEQNERNKEGCYECTPITQEPRKRGRTDEGKGAGPASKSKRVRSAVESESDEFIIVRDKPDPLVDLSTKAPPSADPAIITTIPNEPSFSGPTSAFVDHSQQPEVSYPIPEPELPPHLVKPTETPVSPHLVKPTEEETPVPTEEERTLPSSYTSGTSITQEPRKRGRTDEATKEPSKPSKLKKPEETNRKSSSSKLVFCLLCRKGDLNTIQAAKKEWAISDFARHISSSKHPSVSKEQYKANPLKYRVFVSVAPTQTKTEGLKLLKVVAEPPPAVQATGSTNTHLARQTIHTKVSKSGSDITILEESSTSSAPPRPGQKMPVMPLEEKEDLPMPEPEESASISSPIPKDPLLLLKSAVDDLTTFASAHTQEIDEEAIIISNGVLMLTRTSSKPVYVNGLRVQKDVRFMLSDGAEIRFGNNVTATYFCTNKYDGVVKENEQLRKDYNRMKEAMLKLRWENTHLKDELKTLNEIPMERNNDEDQVPTETLGCPWCHKKFAVTDDAKLENEKTSKFKAHKNLCGKKHRKEPCAGCDVLYRTDCLTKHYKTCKGRKSLQLQLEDPSPSELLMDIAHAEMELEMDQ